MKHFSFNLNSAFIALICGLLIFSCASSESIEESWRDKPINVPLNFEERTILLALKGELRTYHGIDVDVELIDTILDHGDSRAKLPEWTWGKYVEILQQLRIKSGLEWDYDRCWRDNMTKDYSVIKEKCGSMKEELEDFETLINKKYGPVQEIVDAIDYLAFEIRNPLD
jgi:hypothetical protein